MKDLIEQIKNDVNELEMWSVNHDDKELIEIVTLKRVITSLFPDIEDRGDDSAKIEMVDF